MGIDLAESYGWILQELKQGSSLSDSMQRLIGRCEAESPHPDWSLLRSLQYENTGEMEGWLRRPFLQEPPSFPIRGLWFGLFNPVVKRKPSADLYVCGADRFEPTSENMNWAVGPKWWPEARYAGSTILAEIYRIAYRKGGLENDAEYPICLGYSAFLVREMLRSIEPSLLRGESDSIGVAVGFDSGDFIVLGTLLPSGFIDLSVTT